MFVRMARGRSFDQAPFPLNADPDLPGLHGDEERAENLRRALSRRRLLAGISAVGGGLALGFAIPFAAASATAPGNRDFSSARLLLTRAAEAGSAAAALSLGETFDPLVIPQLHAIGVQLDPAKAREWYERAAQLGSDAASQHLAKLAQSPQ